MKRLEWFYIVTGAPGLFVDLLALEAFNIEFSSSDLLIELAVRSWFAILSILALFYAIFAVASWRYWIWRSIYDFRLRNWIEASDEWRRNFDEWKKQEEKRVAEIVKQYEEKGLYVVPMPEAYEKSPPVPPSGFGRSGVYLTVGLGVLAYPLVAVWGLTFIPHIIWSTSNLEFALLLLSPFALSGLAVLTAVITVDGFQYFLVHF